MARAASAISNLDEKSIFQTTKGSSGETYSNKQNTRKYIVALLLAVGAQCLLYLPLIFYYEWLEMIYFIQYYPVAIALICCYIYVYIRFRTLITEQIA